MNGECEDVRIYARKEPSPQISVNRMTFWFERFSLTLPYPSALREGEWSAEGLTDCTATQAL